MADFIFSDSRKTVSQLVKKQNVPTKDINLNSLDIKSKKIIKLQITVYLEDTLNYMQQYNLIPELPETINIKYINLSAKELLLAKFQDLFGKKPPEYNFPASTNLSDNTIYISNYFQQDFNEDSSIKLFREQFNNDIHQTIEYAFFHEIGHLFLIEKNKNKSHHQTNSLFQSLLLNIEEGFAESFAIHMMCLKYPELENTLKLFEENTSKISEYTNAHFNYKKHNLLKKNLKTTLKELIIKETVKIEEIFNSYEFPLIYQKTPFKDENNNLIKDINEIFNCCFETALENNKRVIFNKTKNHFTKEFSLELLKEIQKMNSSLSIDLNKLVDSFHHQVRYHGFLNNNVKKKLKI